MTIPCGLLFSNLGAGIRNIESVSINIPYNFTTATATLAKPVKPSELFIIPQSFSGIFASNFPIITPETIVDGKYTELKAEHKQTQDMDVNCYVLELLGMKSINHYSGGKSISPSKSIPITQVDISKSFIIPLGFSGTATNYGTALLEFASGTSVTLTNPLAGSYSFLVAEKW